MPRNTYEALGGLNFVVDYSSIQIGPGIQIDWDLVPDTYRAGAVSVQLSAAASAGATSLSVDALPVALPLDAQLKFGTYAPVTVTLSAQANAAATSLAVTALSGPIPSGTILDFTGTGEYARTTADAIAGATSISVEALDAQIESADTATFAGGTIGARVTVAAAKGATSVTVDELQFPIADDSTASVDGVAGRGAKFIKAGTVMAKMASKKYVPRAVRPGSETAACLITSNASSGETGDQNVGYTGYGSIIGGSLYENLLPEAVANVISSTYKTELQTAGVGTGFAFFQYSDSR